MSSGDPEHTQKKKKEILASALYVCIWVLQFVYVWVDLKASDASEKKAS